MVKQYQEKHGCNPEKIVMTPFAALCITIKEGISSSYNRIPVEGRDFDERDVTNNPAEAKCLGIFMKGNTIRAVDLKN